MTKRIEKSVGKLTSVKIFLFAIGFMASAFVGTFVTTQNVSAAGRTTPWNSIETARKALCTSSPSPVNIYGVVWVNDTPTSDTSSGVGSARWSQDIVVPYNATNWDVTMWTTAFVCSDASGNRTGMQITNLADAGGNIPISFPYGNDIYRGSAGLGTFSDTAPGTAGEQIGVLRVRLNVSGIPADGIQRCNTYNIAYTGYYQDDQGGGFGTTYNGDICITKQVPPWTATGSTTVSSATAIPGASVSFNHYIRNNGPSSANIDPSVQLRNPAGTVSTVWSGTASSYSSGQQKLVRTQSLTIPTTATAGQQYCQRVSWTPGSSAGGTGFGPYACVTVVYDYQLDPSVLSVPSTTMVGQPVTFTYSVQNTGTKTNTTSMGLRRIVIPPGGTFPAGFGEHGPGASCATYTGGVPAATCTTFGLPSTSFTAGETRTVYTEAGVSTTGLAPGSRLCRSLSVDSRDETAAPNNRDSEVICTVISKAPYLSIVNSDASAGGSTASPYTGTAGFTGYNTFASGFGSFGEYGVVATGAIANFATAGRLVPNRDLMFANTPIGVSGQFQSTHRITDYVSRLAPRGAAGTAATNALNLNGGSQDYKEPVAGDITLTSSNPLAADRKYLIYAPGRDVIIASDIIYTPTVTSFQNAPSVIIVANNIRINANVSRVDAVLFAVNALSTCSQAGQTPAGMPVPAAPISVGGACDGTRLKINGAAIARQVYTPRVSGGATAAELPAEIFSLRPEAFLEPYESNQTSFILRTDVETELPPRN